MKLFVEIVRARLTSIIILAILLVLDVALTSYLLIWQGPRIESLQIRRNELQRALTSGGGERTAIYRQGTADLATFQSLIPPRKSFARVIGEIVEAARNNGLVVSGIIYKANPTVRDGLVDYTVSFSVVGKYAGVKSYFADLQRFREMVVVDQFSLTGARTTEEVVDLKLSLTVYLQAVTR